MTVVPSSLGTGSYDPTRPDAKTSATGLAPPFVSSSSYMPRTSK